MNEKYVIYCHTFPNGKLYFGQTSVKIEDRWRSDGSGYKGQKLMWRAIQKYGWDNIDHRIISIGLDKEEADFQEMFYISAYRTNEREFGYNLTLGGEGCTGVKISDETRKKLSEAKKGRVFTDDTRKKMSESRKGRVFTDDTRKKMSESKKGENHPFYGKHHTEESRNKMSESLRGKSRITKGLPKPKYKWLTPDGNIIEMASNTARRHHPDWVMIQENE